MNVKTKLCNALRPLALGAALALSPLAQAAVVPLDKVVAIVDNDVVMQSQLDQRLNEVKQNITRRGAAAPPESELRQQVLERLILEDIQMQLAGRMGVKISDEELNQAVATIAQRNGLSVADFRKALARDGLSYDAAREQVRREMMISRVRQRQVGQRVQVTQQEVQNFLASDLGKLQLSEEYRRGQHPDPGSGQRWHRRSRRRRAPGPGHLQPAASGRRLQPAGHRPLGR